MSAICETCTKKKATVECGLCHEKLCKSCAQFVEHNQFSFLEKIPEYLSHQVFCSACFDSKIVQEIESYNQTLEQAKEIMIFEKDQGKETRLIKRLVDPIHVTDCADQNEIFLRLAFLAVVGKYNAVVDVISKSKKIKNGSYSTTSWSGSGVPANVKDSQLLKDRSLWQNPN